MAYSVLRNMAGFKGVISFTLSEKYLGKLPLIQEKLLSDARKQLLGKFSLVPTGVMLYLLHHHQKYTIRNEEV